MNKTQQKNVSISDLERFILIAIIAKNNDSYGVEIKNDIKVTNNKDISAGTLYTTLDRLESHGFVKSRFGESTAKRGGRMKRYFQVTKSGRVIVQQSLCNIAITANNVNLEC